MKRFFILFSLVFSFVFEVFGETTIKGGFTPTKNKELYEQETALNYSALFTNEELKNICERQFFVVTFLKNFTHENKDSVLNIYFVNDESEGYEIIKNIKNLKYEIFAGQRPFKKQVEPLGDGNFLTTQYFIWN